MLDKRQGKLPQAGNAGAPDKSRPEKSGRPSDSGEGTPALSGVDRLAPQHVTSEEEGERVETTGDGTTPKGGISERSASEEKSPVRKHLEKTRLKEQEAIQNCVDLVEKMKAVTFRQKNISNEVKKGVAELEECLDFIVHLRKTWLDAEKSLQAKAGKQAVESQPGLKKRALSSPVEQASEKRIKEAQSPRSDDWSETISKKERRRRRRIGECGGEGTPLSQPQATPRTQECKPRETTLPQEGRRERWRKGRMKVRPDVLRIRPAEGKSYAEILGEIRRKMKPEDSETEIKAIRKTSSGDLILELGAATKDKKPFYDEVRRILGEGAVVSSLEPKLTVEIRDLDCLTEKQEVEEALRKAEPEIGDINVGITPEDARGTRVAIVSMGEKAALKIIEIGKIRIGWVTCRVRRRTVVTRCYKCLGYGHVAKICGGPDRSNLCYKCGTAGHKAKDCKEPRRCVLCSERGLGQEDSAHVPGSGRCRPFREALEAARRKAR